MKTYNIMYKGSKINHEPLSKEKAEESLSSIIMNYGYKAELVEIVNISFSGFVPVGDLNHKC